MKPAECHPDRSYWARGLCKLCYATQHRRTHPDYVEYMKHYGRQYRTPKPQWGWFGMFFWLLSLMVSGIVLHPIGR